jgi:hypothetical protein
MSFIERVESLAKRLPSLFGHLETEEATKNALVMPFISALGYDVFNPMEVVPEFTAAESGVVGMKKGEKVDYALQRDGEVIMLIECKQARVDLNEANMSQLYRYFGVTKARIGLLTNGVVYRFFSDIDEPNKMDKKPFLELNLADLREPLLVEVRKLTKDQFDLEKMLSSASDLKYLTEIKRIIGRQLDEPDESFVRFFFAQAHEGRFTAAAKEQFSDLVRRAFQQYIGERVTDRLRSALERSEPDALAAVGLDAAAETETAEAPESDGIATTEEELEGYHIVRAIVRAVLPAGRLTYRDTKSYFGVLVDDNNRKPICRLHFNRTQKYLGLFDDEKNETRIPLESVDSIYDFADTLRTAALRYA